MNAVTEQKRQSALIRVLKVTTSLSAQVTFYASALGATLLVPRADLPSTLTALIGGVGVNALSNILERVARGESVPDEEILSRVLAAIDESRIAEQMANRDTQAMVAGLFRRADLLQNAIQQQEYILLKRLTDQAIQYETLITALRGDIQKLATREQSEQILLFLQDLVQRLEKLNIPQMTALAKNIRPVPLQRPPRIQYFKGRENELEEVLSNLQAGHIVTVCGPGGIGKSAVATQVVWSLAPGDSPPASFPDGITFHSFYNQPQVEFALEAIVIAFGDEPRPTPKDAARRVLASRRALLVLDGAENADDLQAILSVRGSCGVLITSRSRKDIFESGKAISPLPNQQAVQLLQAWGGGRATDEMACRRICELVGGLPLALRIVGRYLVEREVDAGDYLHWLEKTPLAALDLGQRQHESLPVLLNSSAAKLTHNGRLALGIIGLLALAPFPRDFVAAALTQTPSEAGRTLGELLGYGLLIREGDHFQVSHPLIHTYARILQAPEGALDRMGNYFIKFVQVRRNLASIDVQELDVARPHILAVCAHLFERKAWSPVVELGDVLTRSIGEGYLQRRGYWSMEYTLLENAIKACDQLMKAVPVDQEYWLSRLANFEFSLADLWFSRDQYQEALTILVKCFHHYKDLKGRESEIVKTALKLGEIYLNRGDFDRAIAYFEYGLQIYKQIETNDVELALIHLWLGRSYHRREDYTQAQVHYEESLVFYQQARETVESAFILTHLGALGFDMGEPLKGRDYFEKAEELLNDATGDIQRISRVRVELANQYRWKKFFGKAVMLQQQCVDDFESLGDKPNVAWSIQALGDTYFEQRDHKNAERIYLEAIQRFDELGIAHGIAYAYDHLGMIKLELGLLDEAEAFFEKALKIFQVSQLKSGIAYVLFNLGDTYRIAGRVEDAKERYQASLVIWKALSNTERIELIEERLQALSPDESSKNRIRDDNEI